MIMSPTKKTPFLKLIVSHIILILNHLSHLFLILIETPYQPLTFIMCQIIRNIGPYEGQFTFKDHEMLINVTHLHKSQMLFSRLTDQSFPQNLKDIADNILELIEVIKELPDDKIMISQHNELILVIGMGKKSKEFAIGLEKAEISNEESMKKKIDDLQKKLERKTFEASFFKQQYQFLLRHLQLKPNVEELGRLYDKGSVDDIFYPALEMEKKNSSLLSSKSSLSSSSVKVGGAVSIVHEEPKCPNNHKLLASINQHKKFRCNYCLGSIQPGVKKFECRSCDFDLCMKCNNIPMQNRKYCPKRHGLSFGNAGNYTFRQCDTCKGRLNSVEKGYSCKPCDFDICKNCA